MSRIVKCVGISSYQSEIVDATGRIYGDGYSVANYKRCLFDVASLTGNDVFSSVGYYNLYDGDILGEILFRRQKIQWDARTIKIKFGINRKKLLQCDVNLTEDLCNEGVVYYVPIEEARRNGLGSDFDGEKIRLELYMLWQGAFPTLVKCHENALRRAERSLSDKGGIVNRGNFRTWLDQ